MWARYYHKYKRTERDTIINVQELSEIKNWARYHKCKRTERDIIINVKELSKILSSIYKNWARYYHKCTRTERDINVQELSKIS